MKVLFVCPFVPWPLTTGGKVRTYNLLRSAARLAEIHLRLVREPEGTPGAEQALAPWCASVELFDRGRPGSWLRWSGPKLERWFHSPDLRAALERDLAGGFDVVHLDELLLARVLPAVADVPVVQHHHKLDTVLYSSLRADAGAASRFDLWKLHRLEADAAQRYHDHVVCGEDDAKLLRERYPWIRCAVVPSGYDPETYRPAAEVPRDPASLLFLGSMDYGPNVDAVLSFCADTLPELRRRHPGLVLEIVGRAPTPEVQALASDGVVVRGEVPDVQPYLQRATALVVPLRIGGGTRLKIVEAPAVGTPVVSTTIGAQGLGLVDREHVRLADGAQATVGAVEQLLAAPAEAAEMGRRGRAFVEARYRWDTLADELVGLWAAAAPTHAPSR